MPGNGVGDRDHNFFSQENLSHGQGHLEVVDRSWPGSTNNLLVGGQRQSGIPLFPDLKNYNVQQSDIDARHGTHPLQVPQGLGFTQPNLQPEFVASQFQNLQTPLNGYMPGHHLFPAGQNEANFLGMDMGSDQHNMGSKGFPILDSQRAREAELQKRNPVKSVNAEAPMNFQFLGHQEQMGSQHPAVLQSFYGQQNDMQLLQQQLMIKQFQDVQRQQLLQQEIWRKSSTNELSSMGKPASANHSSMPLNGVPINDGPNYSWQSGLQANVNWVQRGASAVVQGSSGSLSLSPEQGQGLRVMGFVPQQVDRSVYGGPNSVSKQSPSQLSQMEVDNPAVQQVHSHLRSVPNSLYTSLPDQSSVQDTKQYEDVAHGLSGGFNSSNLLQVNSPQRNAPVEEFRGNQGFSRLSEEPKGKASPSVAPSQGVATLDPTEERILFGGDENIWGAFATGANTITGGSNLSDATGFLSGFPSVQSGSWSALMQSALAETSSDTQMVQEEWSGLSGQNVEPSVSNQKPSTQNDNVRPQLAWGDDNLRNSSLSSRPLQLSNNTMKSGGASSVSGFQQSDVRASPGQSENIQTDSSGKYENLQADSQRGIHGFLDGNRWLEKSHLQRQSSEGSQICANIAGSSGAEGKRNVSGSWIDQQSVSSLNTGGRGDSKTNSWNVIESMMPGERTSLSNHPSGYSLQPFQSNIHIGNMHEEVGHEVALSKSDSVTPVGLAHTKVIDRPDSTRETSATASLSSRRAHGENTQRLMKNRGFDFWRPVDSSANAKESEVQGNNHNSMDRSVDSSEVSGNSRMYERDNSNEKDNFAGGFHLNSSVHRSTGMLRENAQADAGEPQNLRENKQTLFGLGAQKPAGVQKFQYHPMGNLDVDVESPYGANHVPHSRAMTQQFSGAIRSPGHGQDGHLNFIGQVDRNNVAMSKVDPKGAEGSLKGMLGYTSDKLHPFERSVGTSPSNKNAQSSQKMLELLHKVDQSGEHCFPSHLSSSGRNEINESQTSDGSVSHLQRNQSSASQGFGLQLAPPSQWLQNSDRIFPSQGTSPTFTAAHPFSYPQEMGSSLASTSIPSASSSRGTPQGESRNNVPGTFGQISNQATLSNVEGNTSTPFNSGPTLSRSHFRDQNDIGAGEAAGVGLPVCASSNGIPSNLKGMDNSCVDAQLSQSDLASVPNVSAGSTPSNNAFTGEGTQSSAAKQTHSGLSQQFNSLEFVSPSQPSVNFGFPRGISSKVLPHLWNGSSSQQQLLSAIPGNSALGLLESHLKSNSKAEASSPDTCSAKFQGLVPEEKAMNQCSSDISDPAQCLRQVKEPSKKHVSETTLPKPAASHREIEAFGRFLKPNDNVNGNYSLLHQVQASKSMEVNRDQDDRTTKRLKGSESCLDSQLLASEGGKHVSHGDGPVHLETSAGFNSVHSGDTRILAFSGKPVDNQGTIAASPDNIAFSRNDSQGSSSSSNLAATRGDHPHINPQMAPLWFEQYGALKNGQVLQVYDVRKMATLKAVQQSLSVQKSSDSLQVPNFMDQAHAAFVPSPLGNVCNGVAPTSASEHMSSHYSLPSEAKGQNLHMKPKKRKNNMVGPLAWHKEIAEDATSVRDVSVAEEEWAGAANVLVEKVDSEGDINEDGLPTRKPKRRLFLTTQLMQLLLRPPTAALLTADARSHYESMAYFVSRLTIGDSCSLISCSSSVPTVSPDNEKTLFKLPKVLERTGEEPLVKAMEDLISRTRNLEKELPRLDKRTSIVDLRVECQDLEKFSVINRFAKFHGRGQADGTGSGGLLSEAAASAQKLCPQRYVTALPLPRNLPDRVQCLPL